MAEQTIQDRYFELLKAYVGQPAEESLFAAAELGRELVLAGVPPKDIAELHEGALQRLAQEMPDVTLLDAARLISTPLMKLLMAYGLAFRERLEARDRAEEALQEYSERLEEMVEERTQELRDAQEQLLRREKLATLGRLAGGVAHELRNPLAVISNAVYYLNMVQPDADETIKEYLGIIAQEVRNATKIVTDLLDYARTRLAGREKTAVSALVAQSLEKQPPSEGVQVTTEIGSDLPTVYVDPGQIKEVLTNLVTNAYQAMPNGGRLTIRAQVEGGTVALSVADTGCGISPENMDKLFEPLFTTKTRGIGLGLTISRNLLEANGGSIEVESEVGKGSTFKVRLPAA